MLFARAIPREPLEALHKKVDRALTSAGLEPERRAFLPHITLARRRKAGADPDAWLEAHAAPFRRRPSRSANSSSTKATSAATAPHYEPVADISARAEVVLITRSRTRFSGGM